MCVGGGGGGGGGQRQFKVKQYLPCVLWRLISSVSGDHGDSALTSALKMISGDSGLHTSSI